MLVYLEFLPLVGVRRFMFFATVLGDIEFVLLWLIEDLDFCFAALLDSTV